MKDKNEVLISGRIVSMDQAYTCTKGIIEVERNSGVIDRIPFLTKQEISTHADWVSVRGKLQTRNRKGKDGKNHKKTYVFIEKINLEEEHKNRNEVTLHGTLVHKDVIRKTPKGKTVMDIVVAVNDDSGSQYPSCIVWGSVAENIECLPIGTQLLIDSRFQSREYMKETETGVHVRIAYELSVKTAEVL